MKISIVAPAHNEEDRIRPFLDRYAAYFSQHPEGDLEIIVVVNHSTDQTERLVSEYAARYSFIRMIVEPERIGKGGAVMLGFAHARGDLIGFVDADGATPPEAFMDLVTRAQKGNADLVIASRWLKGSDVKPRQPPSRLVASRLFNLMVRTLFGLRITDSQCGAKVMRACALEKVKEHIGITRWAFDVDLLFQFKRLGFVIEEIPTVWHDVSGSKVAVFSASLEMFVALCRLRLIYSPLAWVVTLYDRSLGRLLKATVR